MRSRQSDRQQISVSYMKYQIDSLFQTKDDLVIFEMGTSPMIGLVNGQGSEVENSWEQENV